MTLIFYLLFINNMFCKKRKIKDISYYDCDDYNLNEIGNLYENIDTICENQLLLDK